MVSGKKIIKRDPVKYGGEQCSGMSYISGGVGLGTSSAVDAKIGV
jgi:hypothetical protein